MYYQVMLNLDEFVKLILDADEETISAVERILTEDQQQTEPQE